MYTSLFPKEEAENITVANMQTTHTECTNPDLKTLVS